MVGGSDPGTTTPEVTMGQISIGCPSGLSGEVRGLKGKEARLLTDRAGARRGETYDKILKGCWLSTTDSGPYTEKEGGGIDWSKVLVGDRFYVLIQIRKATFGPKYAFQIQCKVEHCRARFEWEIDLDDLPVKAFAPEDKEVFVSNNRFETEIDGKKAWYKLIVGHEEQKIAKMTGGGAKEGAIINGLLMRVTEIEGIDKQRRREFFEDMEFSEIRVLIERLDEHDCGIDTSLEIECQEWCGIQEVSLPLEGDFFFPRSKKKST